MKVKGMAWRGVLCAGLMIALGACGGPPKGHPKGGDDEYSQGPGDNGKHDGDEDSDLDDRHPSNTWTSPDTVTPAHLGDGVVIGSNGPIERNKGGTDSATDETIDGTDESSDSTGTDEENECKEKKIISVALQGEIAPGTCGDRFDPNESIFNLMSDGFGMEHPQTNDHGDVAFLASYGGLVPELQVQGETPTQDSHQFQTDSSDMRICLPYGAGVFAYDNDDYRLRAIARTGQETPAGYFPDNNEAYSAPAINDADDVAFSARYLTDGCASSALFVGNVENQDLKMIAKQGDPAPHCGFFDEFFDVAINNDGDVAFIASFDYGNVIITSDTADATATPDGGTADLLPQTPAQGFTGVFLAKKGCRGDEIKPIALFGDRLEGTGGGRLCGVAGPWLNDQGDVLFQATCIYGGNPGLEGSVFIRRHDDEDHDVDPFVLIGDRVDHSYIAYIAIGRPGVNDEEAGLGLVLESLYGPEQVVIATKKLGEHDSCEPEICAENGEYVHGIGELQIGEDYPTIARDGTLAFSAYFGFPIPVPLAQTFTGKMTPPTTAPDSAAQQDVTTDSIPMGPGNAILTCKDRDIDIIAKTNWKKPVPRDFEPPTMLSASLKPDGKGDQNCSDGEYDFRFGFLDEPSNANGYVTFRDPDRFPTGIFLSEPHCGDAD